MSDPSDSEEVVIIDFADADLAAVLNVEERAWWSVGTDGYDVSVLTYASRLKRRLWLITVRLQHAREPNYVAAITRTGHHVAYRYGAALAAGVRAFPDTATALALEQRLGLWPPVAIDIGIARAEIQNQPPPPPPDDPKPWRSRDWS